MKQSIVKQIPLLSAVFVMVFCGAVEGHRKDPDNPSVYSHTDKEHGFSIKYPTWWKIRINEMGVAFLAYDESGASIRIQYRPSPDNTSSRLTLDEMDFDEAKAFGDNWSKSYLNTMRKATDIHENIRIVSQGLVKLRDKGFYHMVYTWNVTGEKKEMTHKVWMHIKQGDFYLLTISFPTSSKPLEKMTDLLVGTYKIF